MENHDPNNCSEDISLIAGSIVADALKIPKSLHCPFCADEYMFEFTLKDHLKRKHPTELKARIDKVRTFVEQLGEDTHPCPYCGAVFYLVTVLPIHIAKNHGKACLQQWQQEPGNLTQLEKEKQSEPSILYAACSPGLSEVFDKLATKSGEESPQPKSILKKTPKKTTPIISSPSRAWIRRNRNEILKRSNSARRELRFDLPPLEKSPQQQVELQTMANQRKCFPNLSRLMFCGTGQYQKKRETAKKSKNYNFSPSKVVTSTPNNCLDDDREHITPKKSKRNSKNQTPARNRPLLFAAERFQCAICKQSYCSNPDLLLHTKNHKSLRIILRPRYRCGQCGRRFYRNSYLVRHCHIQHTPQKIRI